MYRIGYIDDDPTQYDNYRKKIKRRCQDLDLVLLDECTTKKEFVEKIYQEQIDVLLVDYKMAARLGFNGTILISHINDQVRDLDCYILTAVDENRITDGLVAKRNTKSKSIFDTEGDDPEKVKKLIAFLDELKQSAEVFKKRREEKIEQYQELYDKKKSIGLTLPEEEEFLRLYKVLYSYGMIEEIPSKLLTSEFEDQLDKLIMVGESILEKHRSNKNMGEKIEGTWR